jgi:hypothetical protein
MKPSRRSPGPESPGAPRLQRTLAVIADFYDRCKVGDRGNQGYRKSTDLTKMTECAQDLFARGILDPHRTVFMDLGCADGRVNVLLSYFVKRSLGIEIDPEILAEYGPFRSTLQARLQEEGLLPLPANVDLFAGSSLDVSLYEEVARRTGVSFDRIDLFYTYITLHDLFAEKIEREAKQGAFYFVYGFNQVLPSYAGLFPVIRDVGGQGIAALYRKGSEPVP